MVEISLNFVLNTGIKCVNTYFLHIHFPPFFIFITAEHCQYPVWSELVSNIIIEARNLAVKLTEQSFQFMLCLWNENTVKNSDTKSFYFWSTNGQTQGDIWSDRVRYKFWQKLPQNLKLNTISSLNKQRHFFLDYLKRFPKKYLLFIFNALHLRLYILIN